MWCPPSPDFAFRFSVLPEKAHPVWSGSRTGLFYRQHTKLARQDPMGFCRADFAWYNVL